MNVVRSKDLTLSIKNFVITFRHSGKGTFVSFSDVIRKIVFKTIYRNIQI